MGRHVSEKPSSRKSGESTQPTPGSGLKPACFHDVLKREIEEIRRARGRPSCDRSKKQIRDEDKNATQDRAHRTQMVGLAFSGGGIRSATFNLGALQALANLKLLGKFDYLSTVSGGGYIGSWLAAWARRLADAPSPSSTEEQLCESLTGKANKPMQAATEGYHERREIAFLREFSNYLTPRKGLFSADTWTLAAMYVRNLILNLLVLVLALSAGMMLPHAVKLIFADQPNAAVSFTLPLYAFILAGIAAGWTVADLSGRFAPRATKKSTLQQLGTLTKIVVVLPVLASIFLLAVWFRNQTELFGSGLIWTGLGAFLFAAFWFISFLVAPSRKNRQVTPAGGDSETRAAVVVVASIPAGALAGALFWYVSLEIRGWPRDLAVVLGPPLLLFTLIAISAFHQGLVSRGFGKGAAEWWSRLGGLLARSALGWAAVFGLSIYGPLLIDKLGQLGGLILTSGWAATSLTGVLFGRKGGAGGAVKKLLLSVTPVVFIVGLLLLLSCSNRWVMDTLIGDAAGGGGPGWTPELLLPLLMLLVALILSWRIGINEFSMHALYRNRLTRCYLGATNVNRAANAFTGFADDDLDVADLKAGEGFVRPYPIFNTTLNLAGGKRLGWQTRKASGFVFTPMYSGFELVSPDGNDSDLAPEPAYRPTDKYANGPTVGSVMAISGAAASPNMGHYTSAPLAFLMTVFNVRLGQWLGNPLLGKWRRAEPSVGLFYLYHELFGRADDKKRFVYLSDGGHFENLGIYELVRRRCRFIVAFDAEQDRERQFTGLGNAIEKCRTDFGVHINIDVDQIRATSEQGLSPRHCAVGEIRYDKADGPSAPIGKLIYIKATLTGDEQTDVLKYRAKHAEFPHESTGDQWFDESQFESYRALGFHIAEHVFEKGVERAKKHKSVQERQDGETPPVDTETLFVELGRQWYAPSRRAAGSFSKHAASLDRILQTIRSSEKLAFLDAQIYPEWGQLMAGRELETPVELWLPADAAKVRAGFYLCNRVIELMESVYHDLNLEDEKEKNHPDNRGWINLFRRWGWSGMFRVTWAISAGNFGAKFQSFCEHDLRMKLGAIEADTLESHATEQHLNFLERKIIDSYRDSFGDFTIFHFCLRVDAPVKDGQHSHSRFSFGFALVDGDTLFYMRVRDHLRKLGLAREALRELMRDFVDSENGEVALRVEHRTVKGVPVGPRQIRRFRELFHSVKNELED